MQEYGENCWPNSEVQRERWLARYHTNMVGKFHSARRSNFVALWDESTIEKTPRVDPTDCSLLGQHSQRSPLLVWEWSMQLNPGAHGFAAYWHPQGLIYATSSLNISVISELFVRLSPSSLNPTLTICSDLLFLVWWMTSRGCRGVRTRQRDPREHP